MNYKNLTLILFLPVILIACANNQKKQPEITEIFVTNISPSGLKLFSYSVTMGMPNNSGNGRGEGKGRKKFGGEGGMSGRRSSGKPDREAMTGKMKDKINEKLNLKLAENGYCREGFIELDSVIGSGRSQIRGECNEGATDDDRKKFASSNNIKS